MLNIYHSCVLTDWGVWLLTQLRLFVIASFWSVLFFLLPSQHQDVAVAVSTLHQLISLNMRAAHYSTYVRELRIWTSNSSSHWQEALQVSVQRYVFVTDFLNLENWHMKTCINVETFIQQLSDISNFTLSSLYFFFLYVVCWWYVTDHRLHLHRSSSSSYIHSLLLHEPHSCASIFWRMHF